MAETTETPTLYATVEGTEYPFIVREDLTGRQVDWIERKCGKSIEDASAEGRHVLTQAWVAVCICAAKPSADIEEVFNELWDLPSGALGVIAKTVEPADDEPGPTKPARTRAKSADSGPQK